MNIDITRFLDVVRQNNLSLYYSLIFAVTTVANECENLRYHIRGGRVILHDKTHPSFTGMTHTIKLNPDDAAPRISWGRYFRENGRVLIPFSVQLNHALADGLHLGEYVNRLQAYLDAQ